MIFPQFTAWKLYFAAAVLAVFFMGGAYVKGRMDGRDLARTETLKATLDQLKERAETNAEIRNMSDADLCIALGGRMHDGNCQ